MFRHLLELDLVKHHVAFDKALLHIDDALVAGATELEFERLLRHNERTVDEDVGKREKFKEPRTACGKFHEAFVGVARENHEVESAFLDGACTPDGSRYPLPTRNLFCHGF